MKKGLLLTTAILAALLVSLAGAKSARAAEYECGDVYLGMAPDCTCDNIDPTGREHSSGRIEWCCGWWSDEDKNCFATEEALNNSISEGIVDCGTEYFQDSGKICVCEGGTRDSLISRPMVPRKKKCCGWYINGECLEKYSYKICTQIKDADVRAKCEKCVGSESEPGMVDGVWTAIGCIPTNHEGIVQALVRIGIGLGGGFALLNILVGSFKLTVSEGDPKKTSDAKEVITSAIIGLIFIIFSVSILQLIGVQILRIPSFGV